jgi:CDP-glucose 4,6-dehydratase
MKPQFWHNRKVFITGHTGFKGGWLSLWLARHGAQVCGYGLPPDVSSPSFFNICEVDKHISRSIIADVRHLCSLKEAIRVFEPEVVFHLAAQALVRDSYEDPVLTFETNVMGTVHVLEAIRTTPSVKAVINVTTDKCYGNQEWVWGYREIDPLGGNDPYSSSKACSELVTNSYRKSFLSNHTLVASARAGNVIGGGDWSKDRLIPDIVRAADSGRPLVIRNPLSVRPWQHVLDPLSAYISLAEGLIFGKTELADAWNFGPSALVVRPVSWIVEHFSGHYGVPVKWETCQADQPSETSVLKLDSSKARMILGWNPRFSIDEALQWTASWYETYRKQPSKIGEFTRQQLADYESRSPTET